MTLQNEGVGYDDLNELVKCPGNLEFTIELLKMERPDEFTKDPWQMNEDERLQLVPELRSTGNAKFKQGNFKEASDSYAQAIGILEQLMLKEKPNDKEWLELDKQKVPLLLNYSQCKLNEGDFYSVIEHCSTVLKSDPANVKALFRRAKAYVGAWNPGEAKKDFSHAAQLDSSLISTVKREMQALDELQKLKDNDDKTKLKNLFG